MYPVNFVALGRDDEKLLWRIVISKHEPVLLFSRKKKRDKFCSNASDQLECSGPVWNGLGNYSARFSKEEFRMHGVLNEIYLRNLFRDGRNISRRI